MSELHDTAERRERCFLVGVQSGTRVTGRKTSESEAMDAADAENLLRELGGLADSLGLERVGTLMVKLRERTPNLLVGSGKADEIVAAAKAAEADSIVFDHALSPIHQRNWEKLSGLKVYDRAELIIKIFSSRAMTSEARLQVELAKLQYSLPRLAHSYEDLSRQRGGRYGTKGSGEQKIELDRRSIEKRIHEIKDELKTVRTSRDVQRRRRERQTVPRAAIVGYTNAGKSSLLNTLSSASVLAEDKLFATLDPTTRRIALDSGSTVLLTDTVGFIRNLPHGLVEAFKATLEEAAVADLLIHVADASDPEVESHMRTTESVLAEIGAGELPRILVLNKIDLAPEMRDGWLQSHPGGVLVSARTGFGLGDLVARIGEVVAGGMQELELRIPHADYAMVALLRREAHIVEESHDDEAAILRCRVPERLLSRIERYIQGK